jgi:peroxiredoxin
MNAYRDQYAQLFGDDGQVVLLAISVDPADTLAAWAKDQDYPFTFLSDPGAEVGRKFGAYLQRSNGTFVDNRTLFVIRNGTIRHVMAPFREIDPSAYEELGAVIQRVRESP